jgi:hypothetical protein
MLREQKGAIGGIVAEAINESSALRSAVQRR